jgi:tetratricopeptide (TPR) repeat protein
MSAHFQRGELLYDQDRYDQAVGEFQAHLSADPEDSYAHCLMAISLAHLKKHDDALSHAREAIQLDPESGFPFFALAQVEMQRGRYEPAASAMAEAIQCNPAVAGYHGLLAAIRVRQRRWKDAAEAADIGLSCDPEDLSCLNMRAIALRNLGDGAAARDSIRDALARDPDNAFSHANQGWALLETGEAEQALVHFREALRIQPDLEFARQGIIEALKARNRFYRALLQYQLWIGKKGYGAQIGVMLAVVAVLMVLGRIAAASPHLATVLVPLRVSLAVLAVSTWFAQPVSNLALLFHPLGRLALSSDQKWQGGLAGVCAVAYLSLFLLPQITEAPLWHFDAFLIVAFFTLAALSIHDCDRGWPRWACIGLTLVAPLLPFLPRLMWLVLPAASAALFQPGRYYTIYVTALFFGLIWLTDKLEDVEVRE